MHRHEHGPRLFAWAIVLGVAGCGPSAPFPLTKVSGTVAYEGGDKIPGDRIVVTFHPDGMSATGKAAPKFARTEVDPSTGEFRSATTWQAGDGVIVGRHKVTVESFRTLPNGVDAPNGAVPREYSSPSQTPLSVEIERGGDPLALTVAAPSRS